MVKKSRTFVSQTESDRPGCSHGASRNATAGNLIKCLDPFSLSIGLSADDDERNIIDDRYTFIIFR